MLLADNSLCESYEELRSQATGKNSLGATPRGLALFLHQGMPAWISAWSRCAPPIRTAMPNSPGVKDRLLLDALRTQVAVVLVSMALQAQKEVQL